MRLIFFKWRKKKPFLIFKGKGHTKKNIELKARKDAYFQAMLILKYHSFGKRLFSNHAYFQVRAYFRENTVFDLLLEILWSKTLSSQSIDSTQLKIL